MLCLFSVGLKNLKFCRSLCNTVWFSSFRCFYVLEVSLEQMKSLRKNGKHTLLEVLQVQYILYT